MEEVYLVLTDNYGDTVRAVFSSLELAEEYAEKTREIYSTVVVEKWLVDEMKNDKVITRYLSTIDLHTGDIVTNSYKMWKTEEEGAKDIDLDKYMKIYVDRGIRFYTTMSEISQEHARELAREAREAYLRAQDRADVV